MVEYAFQLSQSTSRPAQITFVINNKGNEVHNFAILGNKAGAQIGAGHLETWTVSLPPGTYNYQCDVPFHARTAWSDSSRSHPDRVAAAVARHEGRRKAAFVILAES